MAATMSTPTIDMSRLRLRHHLAFSYRRSSTGSRAFSRSRIMVARLMRAPTGSFSLWVGRGGRGRNEATNQAYDQSQQEVRARAGACLPIGNTKPRANKTIWAVLLLMACPSASSSRLGATNRLLRPIVLLSCHK